MNYAASDNPLIPAIYDIVWSAVVLVILGFFFIKYLLPKLNVVLDERAATIEEGLKLTEQAKLDAQQARETRDAEIAAARQEAAGIRDQANNDGAAIVAEAKSQASGEATRILAQAQRQIEAERTSAVVSLREEIGGLATELAGKIVGETLADDARQSRVIDRFLDDLDASVSTQGASEVKES